mgnify:CR=1 FL=1
MATYPPPTETLPTFNSTVFTSPLTDSLTIAEADLRYLKFPISQGSETIAGDLTVSGTLTAGTFAPTSITCDTLQGTSISSVVSLYSEATRSGRIEIGTGTTDTRDIFIGTNAIVSGTKTRIRGANIDIQSQDTIQITNGGLLTITAGAPITISTGATQNISIGANMTNTASFQIGGTSGGSATYTIASGNAQTGTISFGSGTGTKTMTIGGTNTTLNLVGSAITASRLACNTYTTSAVGTTASLFDEASRNGIISIGTGTNRSGAINIGNGGGASSSGAVSIGGGASSTGGVNILTTGGGTASIGNGTIPVRILGTVEINNTGTADTKIGNGTGTTSFTGTVNINDNVSLGASSADLIVPNGTLTKPLIIGTYASQSSFSLSSSTPLTTYLGGTLETTNTFSNVATGTFVYPMSSITPYTAGGGLLLTAGTYMFWMGINWEDGSAFDMTDCRMGLSNDGTLSSASSEAVIVSALPNLTCYFHKTDATSSAVSDSENRVVSGCFNIASATTMFPFFVCNYTITIDTVKIDVIFTKIGSA